jgi:DNA processing protein
MGPAQLVALLTQGSPASLWEQILSGHIRRPEPRTTTASGRHRIPWAVAAARIDVARRWQAMDAAGVHVAYLGAATMPGVLARDPEPPGVLFSRGHLGVLERPCVAIVGTRNCTGYGRSLARELGHDLASCGICVVSGLALGIDGAAHEGALSAPAGAGPLGVAASGVDVPYPRRHAALWAGVASSGAVISETAPGRSAQSWRFPSRNRLIAAVSSAVVVVESHAAGGSMLTVAAAAERGVEVLAVPGPVNSASSAGTNQLLHEGLTPVRHAGDVLAAIGDLRPWPPAQAATVAGRRFDTTAGRRSGDPSRRRDPRGRPALSAPALPTSALPAPALTAPERRVLEAVDRTPTATSVIADRAGLSLTTLSSMLLRLEASGLIRGAGMWWERSVP